MIPGLGSIIERVTGLFGKTYFLAGFFPVLFLLGVSLLAGYDSIEWIHRQVNGFRAMDAARQALASGAVLTVAAMLGFVYWSAAPWWRALLQGGVFPGRLREALVVRQRRRLEALQAAVKQCEDRAFDFRVLHPEHPAQAEPQREPAPPPAPPAGILALVRETAAGLLGAGAPPLASPSAPKSHHATPTWMQRLLAAREQGDAQQFSVGAAPSAALCEAFKALQKRIWGLEPIGTQVLGEVCLRLEQELAMTRVTSDSELDRMHVEFASIADSARARAENALNRTLSERRARFPVNLSVVGPTRMANAAELYRDYALTRYRMDPEVFWLHLQRAAAADDRFRPILEEARLKLDVSVAMAIACGLGSVWAIIVGIAGHSLPILLMTGVGLPVGTVLFYNATVANLRVYGEAVSATVDLFRFEVLKALHLSPPADSVEERATWQRLTINNQLLGDEEVTYAHS